jgi:hypothetical protein
MVKYYLEERGSGKEVFYIKSQGNAAEVVVDQGTARPATSGKHIVTKIEKGLENGILSEVKETAVPGRTQRKLRDSL